MAGPAFGTDVSVKDTIILDTTHPVSGRNLGRVRIKDSLGNDLILLQTLTTVSTQGNPSSGAIYMYDKNATELVKL